MNDLFGNPIEPPKLTGYGKPKRNETARGYGGTPGKGPAGHFCRDCRHLCRKHMSKTYLKCWLVHKTWSGGPKTDIRAKSPACENWAPKQQIDPDATHMSAHRDFSVRH